MRCFDDAENDNPSPPSHLYKYLSAERVANVLEQGTVRFTPLMNTNDSFEVRATFKRLAGPRFLEMLAEQVRATVSEANIHAMMSDQLQKLGLGSVPPEFALQMLGALHGEDFGQVMRKTMEELVDSVMVPLLSDPAYAETMLEELGGELLCFSLSERADIPPMWAHYADNHQGFVVAFDTSNDWFTTRKNGEPTRIRKVAYFDGMLEEPLENPSVAFCSKTTHWEYEREWRLYAKVAQVDATFGDPRDPVHVIAFPPEAITRVIVGAKASEKTVERIRSVQKAKYPHVRLTKAEPNRRTQSYDEVDL